MIKRMINPDYTRWRCPVFFYQTLQEFLTVPRLDNGIHSIIVNGQYVEFLLHRKPSYSNDLLVVFSAAVRRQNTTGDNDTQHAPPFFSGVGISAAANCTLMAISDPSFYLDSKIELAWYAGSKYFPLQSILPSIIDKVASMYSSRIIMTGGSGGGFASLYYATKTTKPSIAFVYNPQTNIIKYDQKVVNYYAKICFEWQTGNPESAFSNITFDLTKYYLEKKAPIIYFQNSGDPHIQSHAIPFLKVYGLDWTGTDQTTDGLYFHVHKWGEGHFRPPIELIAYVIKKISSSKGSLNDVVNSAHFFIVPPCYRLF
jgi:hypothetical protein